MLKAFWNVTAGIIPGESDPQFTRHYEYTSDDYASDQQNGPKIFNKIKYEASEYALDITNPGLANWVKTEFVWV